MSDAPGAADRNVCRRWDVPQLDDGAPYGAGMDAGQQAREKGFEQGRQEGLEAGRKQVLAQLAVLQRLMQTLATPLAELDEQVEKELVALAMTVARQVVYRELQTDPGLVLGAVRKALGVLPAGLRDVRVHLHPEDARLVRDLLAAGEAEAGWQIVEDSVHERGDCRVSTPNSQVDATTEARLVRAVAAVLGESGENA
ncbi:MAG: flagellar assembly protein FliH [Gammaproteobacteria bacterium]